MSPKEFREVIFARGHSNILATHRSTLEITKEPGLSRQGDCIIAVSSAKALVDLSSDFKENLRADNARISILIEVEDVSDTVNAFGNSRLVLNHPTDIVVRKSGYVCNRTLAIRADKAACDLSRRLVEKLKNPQQKVRIALTVRV